MAEKKLDKKKLEQYKKLLMKMKEDILHDIQTMSKESNGRDREGDVSGHALHMADVATDMYDKEFNLGLASKDRELLAKIDGALKRIADGSYGFCLGTGKPIKAARLKAIPYAEHCREYQEKIEAEQDLRR